MFIDVLKNIEVIIEKVRKKWILILIKNTTKILVKKLLFLIL